MVEFVVFSPSLTMNSYVTIAWAFGCYSGNKIRTLRSTYFCPHHLHQHQHPLHNSDTSHEKTPLGFSEASGSLYTAFLKAGTPSLEYEEPWISCSFVLSHWAKHPRPWHVRHFAFLHKFQQEVETGLRASMSEFNLCERSGGHVHNLDGDQLPVHRNTPSRPLLRSHLRRGLSYRKM